MFTGLIEGVGHVRSVEARGGQSRLRIEAPFLQGLAQGESIAVSGACLSVETFGPGWFTVYASAETLARTNLGELRPGAAVNLERALALGARLGGHMVSGHVDCLATVAAVAPAGESRVYRLAFPPEQGPLVIEKGSVALDGISLTVNACGPDWLAVNIIPETQKVTTAFFPVGESEVELLESTSPDGPVAKFIEKKGTGFQHVAFRVADIDAALKDRKSVV